MLFTCKVIQVMLHEGRDPLQVFPPAVLSVVLKPLLISHFHFLEFCTDSSSCCFYKNLFVNQKPEIDAIYA